MTPAQMEARTVRYGDLVACRSAFIDAHTPGSDTKENFCIIGGGVSESPDQHVHIAQAIGFNVGAAGQPPRCTNSLHAHTTAEVFFVHSGRWRFFWGLHGDAGEVVLEAGDLFDIPTGIFRGFENIGTDYGMIMALLGGDDAGGGVTWAPHVIRSAKAHGLVLSSTGRLYNTAKGEALPANEAPMAVLDDGALSGYPELPTSAVVPRFVARYLDMAALAKSAPAQVLGAGNEALINDRPGFEVEFLGRDSLEAAPYSPPYTTHRHEVLMVHRGHWRLEWDGGQSTLAPGDTCAVPPDLRRTLVPAMTGECALFRVRNTDDPAGSTALQSNCR